MALFAILYTTTVLLTCIVAVRVLGLRSHLKVIGRSLMACVPGASPLLGATAIMRGGALGGILWKGKRRLLLSRDPFEIEEMWIESDTPETFSEWKERQLHGD